VTYLQIDSIQNLPAGLCWETNKADNKFNGGETGVIYVSGTATSANPGQYKLRIIIDIRINNLITLPKQDAEQLTASQGSGALRYYVR
ncbi:hypothetical protein, partial [Staphylococcus aureus]